MPREFFPFVEEAPEQPEHVSSQDSQPEVLYPARIAVYDDPSVTPRVVVIEPMDVRDYLAEITKTVTQLAKEQGGSIPFTIIREIVENFIHAAFIEPTITILDSGNTIRFCDQGPGIKEKDKALQFGTTSATDAMKHYIRGVGSGLPIAQQYMLDKGGSLEIQDNISSGTIVTISTRPKSEASIPLSPRETALPINPEQPVHAGLTGGTQGTANGYGMPGPENVQATTAGAAQVLGATMYGVPQQQVQPAYPNSPNQNPWGSGQAWQQMPGWNQYGMQNQQMAASYGMPAMPSAPVPQASDLPHADNHAMVQSIAGLQLSDRQKQALALLSQQGSVGGKQLAESFGGSTPTWSRELSKLDSLGITMKDGQKRYLTEIGKAYVQVLNNLRLNALIGRWER